MIHTQTTIHLMANKYIIPGEMLRKPPLHIEYAYAQRLMIKDRLLPSLCNQTVNIKREKIKYLDFIYF